MERLGHWRGRVAALLPGLLVCGVIALAATFLAEHYGGPQLLYALLIGLSFHFLHSHPTVKAGVDFCGRTLLRLGVALLGARITLDQVVHLGWQTAAMVVVALVSTIALGVLLARWLGRSRDEGFLSGGAVAVCGASAAMAIASVLPATRENERFTLLVVVGVTVLSTVAMVVYPFMTPLLGLDTGQAGVFLGATIHDVAQVVAAGMMLGPEAGDTATVVKLFRVMLLMPVVLVIAYLYRAPGQAVTGGGHVPLVPGFLVAFIALVLLASAGIFNPQVVSAASDASRALLVLAIAAAGVKTSFEELLKLGWQPVWMLVAETLFLALLVLVAIRLLG
jgi:uncharacterized integral membrane protein (TIGR00698 family)